MAGGEEGEGKKVSLPPHLDWYDEQGFALIPLVREESSKKPLIRWKEYEEKRPTKEQISAWWNSGSKRFAIVCGEVSDNLAVIDIDRGELFAGLNLGVVAAKTYTEERDGKFHIFLRTTKPIKHKTLQFEEQEDISIRFNNDLVIAANTEHPSGGAYKHFLTSPKEIATVEVGFFNDLEKIWRDYRGVSDENGRKGFARPLKGYAFKKDILSVIKSCTELKELRDSGDTATCRCPFPKHIDKTPSFAIYKKTDSYYCFGCNKGGDAITFVKDFYGISKKEAKERLVGEEVLEKEKSLSDGSFIESIKNTIEDAETPKYHGTVNFDPDMGIFYTVPLTLYFEDKSDENHEPIPSYIKPIIFNPIKPFAQDIKMGEILRDKDRVFAHEQEIKEVFSPYCKTIEGTQIYLSSKQRVQILRLYLTLVETNEMAYKYDRREIEMIPASNHIPYFKNKKDIEHYIIICWAIGTYLFPMFSVFPYLLFIGEKGTNKSGQLQFLSRICWNPTSKLALPNEAPLFRLIYQAKPTQLIDEAHRQLNDPIRGPTLQALLETGHEQGGCVPRCDDNDKNKINFYDTYSPKALASREPLELEEKSITIILEKDFNKEYAIARKNLENDPKLDAAQGELLNFVLSEWKNIYDEYQTIQPTPKLSGRYFLLWAPILAICKVAYPDKFNEMLKYAEEAVVNIQKGSFEVEIQLLSWLLTHVDETESSIYLKEVTDDLNKGIPKGERQLSWQSIKGALRNLGLIKKDGGTTSRGKRFYLHVDRIEKLAKERSITTEETTEDELSGEEIREAIEKLPANKIRKIKRLEKEMVGECDICKSHLKPLVCGIKGEHGDIKKAFCEDCIGKTKRDGYFDDDSEKPTPIEIKKIILEVGKCIECGKEEIDLIYVVHYSNDEFKKVCDACGQQIMKGYNLKLIGGDEQ